MSTFLPCILRPFAVKLRLPHDSFSKRDFSRLNRDDRTLRVMPGGAEVRRPQLVAFDMDYTLWPFHVDCIWNLPLNLDTDGKIKDKKKTVYEPFPGVTAMIKGLFEKDQLMALVSRTDAPTVGRRMLELLDWNQYFPYQEIYPGQKTTHFARIQKLTGIPYKDMLFFDDEHRNIRDISALGVTCVFVKEPMSQELLDRGLAMFAKGESDR